MASSPSASLATFGSTSRFVHRSGGAMATTRSRPVRLYRRPPVRAVDRRVPEILPGPAGQVRPWTPTSLHGRRHGDHGMNLPSAITLLTAEKRAIGYKYDAEERVLTRFEASRRAESPGWARSPAPRPRPGLPRPADGESGRRPCRASRTARTPFSDLCPPVSRSPSWWTTTMAGLRGGRGTLFPPKIRPKDLSIEGFGPY